MKTRGWTGWRCDTELAEWTWFPASATDWAEPTHIIFGAADAENPAFVVILATTVDNVRLPATRYSSWSALAADLGSIERYGLTGDVPALPHRDVLPPGTSVARDHHTCQGCGEQIELGEVIVRSHFGWVHPQCRTAGATRTQRQPVIAKYEGPCQGCTDPILPGQLVTTWLWGWLHADCVGSYPGTHRRTAVGYNVACPKCGSAADERCVTPSGKPCPVHAGRRAVELASGATSTATDGHS
jgi:hypothetical protein